VLESETSEQTYFRRIETELGQIAQQLFGKQISKFMRGFAGIGRRDRHGLMHTLRDTKIQTGRLISDDDRILHSSSSENLYRVQNCLFSIITCTCNHSWYNSSLLYICVYIQYVIRTISKTQG